MPRCPVCDQVAKLQKLTKVQIERCFNWYGMKPGAAPPELCWRCADALGNNDGGAKARQRLKEVEKPKAAAPVSNTASSFGFKKTDNSATASVAQSSRTSQNYPREENFGASSRNTQNYGREEDFSDYSTGSVNSASSHNNSREDKYSKKKQVEEQPPEETFTPNNTMPFVPTRPAPKVPDRSLQEKPLPTPTPVEPPQAQHAPPPLPDRDDNPPAVPEDETTRLLSSIELYRNRMGFLFGHCQAKSEHIQAPITDLCSECRSAGVPELIDYFSGMYNLRDEQMIAFQLHLALVKYNGSAAQFLPSLASAIGNDQIPALLRDAGHLAGMW